MTAVFAVYVFWKYLEFLFDTGNTKYVKVKKLHPDAQLPKYAYEKDTGFDLYTVEHYLIHPGATVAIATGLAFELPEDFEIQIRPRSGLSLKTGLRVANSPGSVDNKFRGEVKVIIQNVGSSIEEIQPGTRIAQGVLAPVWRANFLLVDEISETERSNNGFGSSGVK